MTRLFINAMLRIRWVYFHINPMYSPFYIDSTEGEKYFYHQTSNSIVYDMRLDKSDD